MEKRLKILSLYLCMYACFEFFVIFLSIKGINNMPLQHIVTPVQFCFLGVIYYLSYHHPVLRKLTIALMVVVCLFTIINAILIQSALEFNSNSRGLSAILILILAIIYFYQTFQETVITNLNKHPMFWINSGFLIYFSWNLFLFIFNDATPEFYLQYWSIHSVFYIVLNILISMGLWVGQKK